MPTRLPDHDPRTDEGLMLAYGNGEAAAFEILYARWRRRLFRYLSQQCGQTGTCDELFQDIWLRVINARRDYQATAPFHAWLFRIARNRLLDHWRSQQRTPSEAAAFPDDEAEYILAGIPAADDASPERRAERRALAEHLVAAVQALPEAQREAFLLAEDGGLSLEEIAQLTEVGRETVKSRLRYAMGKLRQELAKWR